MGEVNTSRSSSGSNSRRSTVSELSALGFIPANGFAPM
jgi:hypothetical protein